VDCLWAKRPSLWPAKEEEQASATQEERVGQISGPILSAPVSSANANIGPLGGARSLETEIGPQAETRAEVWAEGGRLTVAWLAGWLAGWLAS